MGELYTNLAAISLFKLLNDLCESRIALFHVHYSLNVKGGLSIFKSILQRIQLGQLKSISKPPLSQSRIHCIKLCFSLPLYLVSDTQTQGIQISVIVPISSVSLYQPQQIGVCAPVCYKSEC